MASPPASDELLDAHAHLTDARFAGDLDEVLDRAARASVMRILTCGEDVASSERALGLAARHAALRVAAGVHPHRAGGFDAAALARIRELAADPRVVAIGEIGLDLSGRSAPREDQERAFAAQLALAAELGLPVVVHVRDAGAEAREIVDRGPSVRGQLHCYSEGPDEVHEWLGRGFHLSFAGTVTFPGSLRLREAARAVPAGRLLVETDAPYLAPEPYRGGRNEPAHVSATYARLAAERGTSLPELAREVRAAAGDLFGARWEA
ncbi:MAG TPA: TatD family hydrolase [Candidatus Limnocylindrales bacterium]|nr:TatD family hydrolase [Candidatus Limnocylindrales bacterium]